MTQAFDVVQNKEAVLIASIKFELIFCISGFTLTSAEQ